MGEKPDMWMQSVRGILGIEHTRIVRGQVRAEEDTRRTIIRTAQHLFESSGGPDLQLWASFRKDHIAKDETDEIARAIARVVARNIPEQGGRNLLQMWRLAPAIRPPKVIEIDISRWVEPVDGFWTVSLGGGVPRLTSDKIQEMINAKEPKLEDYRKRCDILWLLIALDGLSPSGWWDISQDVVKAEYRSSFDRVILYDHSRRQSYTIADAPPGRAGWVPNFLYHQAG